MPSALLGDRGVLAVSGVDARAFLDRLLTCDVDTVVPGRARFGALLTPQGKILADFVIQTADPAGESFLLDVPHAAVADLAKRLALYRLRARIAVEDRSEPLAIAAGWGDASALEDAVAAAPDPRLAALGWRAVVARAGAPAGDPAAYEAHRLALGIPKAGLDFVLGDAFPHESLMDQLFGVDFDKGCYVGQEVVSRMQHRGTARTRVVPILYGTEAPIPGQDVTAGDRVLGRVGSAGEGRGLAMLRLDRVADALAAEAPIMSGGVTLRIEKPDWVRFPFPGASVTTAA